MKKLNVILVFLVSNLVITGISFVDGKIWDVIFIVVGMIAYSVVGFLFSIGFLSSKKQGKEVYAATFFLLIMIGFAAYKGLVQLRSWIISWPLIVRIIVPFVISAGLVTGIVIVVIRLIKEKKQLKIDNNL